MREEGHLFKALMFLSYLQSIRLYADMQMNSILNAGELLLVAVSMPLVFRFSGWFD